MDGLNPSNGLVKKFIASIHGKDSDLCEQEEISEDVNSKMCADEELLGTIENLKAFAIGLNVVCGDQKVVVTEQEEVPVSPEMQDGYS